MQHHVEWTVEEKHGRVDVAATSVSEAILKAFQSDGYALLAAVLLADGYVYDTYPKFLKDIYEKYGEAYFAEGEGQRDLPSLEAAYRRLSKWASRLGGLEQKYVGQGYRIEVTTVAQ